MSCIPGILLSACISVLFSYNNTTKCQVLVLCNCLDDDTNPTADSRPPILARMYQRTNNSLQRSVSTRINSRSRTYSSRNVGTSEPPSLAGNSKTGSFVPQQYNGVLECFRKKQRQNRQTNKQHANSDSRNQRVPFPQPTYCNMHMNLLLLLLLLSSSCTKALAKLIHQV